MAITNAMMSSLHLVFPPVSSFEAEWLKDDKAAEAWLRDSDFYMLAMRPEVRFEDSRLKQHGNLLVVPLTCHTLDGTVIRDEVVIDGMELAVRALGAEPQAYCVEAGPKILKFWAGTEDDFTAGRLEAPFEWFTTEKLLYDAGRCLPGISGLGRHREFARYELLYVGIAKSGDTFDRLFKGAHHARQRILSSEYARRDGSRVTDELILFPFRLDPLTFRILGSEDVPTQLSDDDWHAYGKLVVADAEKAFVHLLDPQYNIQKFKNYPKGNDGVYGRGHERYGYVIAENLTLDAPNGIMHGSWDCHTQRFDNEADWIFVEGDNVELRQGDRSTAS
ncbi:hypothetical protein [Leucobacter sp. M11]|uniref:hypothetical protein n=1 Tax=Leucobacter sp. M11 TaxID=2993565 RepID=UPI002D807792|nr:hypothetical protein [Leucobacter sp. M11]MEB4613267.1 hypothetical protein [Leucobacter sp. M11]